METDLRMLAAEVAKSLGDGWGLEPKESFGDVMLAGPDGGALYLYEPQRKYGYVAVSPLYPHPTAYRFRPGETGLEINVRADRGAETIAREVTRRLLPTYTKALTALHAADRRYRAAFAARETYAARLYTLLGKTPPVLEDWDEEDWEKTGLPGDSTSIDLSGLANGDGSVEVDFDAHTASLKIRHISAEKVLAIVEMLAQK
jgi:hypothetical protein